MGAAVGQVPEYIEHDHRVGARRSRGLPVIVKLTPNITDITLPGARRARRAAPTRSRSSTPSTRSWASTSTRLTPRPDVGRPVGSHGGYCGPAVKPIALNMVRRDRARPGDAGIPISGIGGITTWRDAAEFIAARRRQRAGLHGGHALRLPHRRGHDRRPLQLDGREGLQDHRRLPRQGGAHQSPTGRTSTSTIKVARRSTRTSASAAGCCYVACEDSAHQAIAATMNGKRHFEVERRRSASAATCARSVCPVTDCITMRVLEAR